ncbi:MAG: hypothetical protein K2X98_04705 [Alphaproteobacteria bacterium]|nr:hypothetical protein [Alphaproteobacteria bacterium]
MSFVLFAIITLLMQLPLNAMDDDPIIVEPLSPSTSMQPLSLAQAKVKLNEKIKAFKEYVDDAVDYYEELKKVFDPHNPENLEKFNERISLLNESEQKIVLEHYKEALKQKKGGHRILPKFAKITAFKWITSDFDDRIKRHRNWINSVTLIEKALESEPLERVFMGSLSLYEWSFLNFFIPLYKTIRILLNVSPIALYYQIFLPILKLL